MALYSSYNMYSSQFQYYNPYSYSSYQTIPYGMMTGRKNCLKSSNINLCVNLDGSFQRHYYAVDGKVSDNTYVKAGVGIFAALIKFGLKILGQDIVDNMGDFTLT